MAFLFLLGGPSAEAGPFLRNSGYIYSKQKGAANIWPTHGQHGLHGQHGQHGQHGPRRGHGHA
eukprot:1481035-Prymnesium_polylepis.1